MTNGRGDVRGSALYRVTVAIVSAAATAMLGFMAGRVSAAHGERPGSCFQPSEVRPPAAGMEIDFSPSPPPAPEEPPPDPPSAYGFNQPG